MKKVMVIIMMVVMMFGFTSAFADNNEKYEAATKCFYDIDVYLQNNDLYDLYEIYHFENDDNRVYHTVGTMDIEEAIELFNLSKTWDTLEEFSKWYETELNARCTQYGKTEVEIKKMGNINGTEILYMTIIAENDLVDYIQGEQVEVRMMCAFY